MAGRITLETVAHHCLASQWRLTLLGAAGGGDHFSWFFLLDQFPKNGHSLAAESFGGCLMLGDKNKWDRLT